MELRDNRTMPQGKKTTSTLTRALALVGALFMVLLTLLFTYSVATGAIFAW